MMTATSTPTAGVMQRLLVPECIVHCAPDLGLGRNAPAQQGQRLPPLLPRGNDVPGGRVRRRADKRPAGAPARLPGPRGPDGPAGDPGSHCGTGHQGHSPPPPAPGSPLRGRQRCTIGRLTGAVEVPRAPAPTVDLRHGWLNRAPRAAGAPADGAGAAVLAAGLVSGAGWASLVGAASGTCGGSSSRLLKNTV
jgi:hypothetical protein